MLNIWVKMPLIFLILFSFIGSLTFLEGEYAQAINIVFFVPVLFINWNKPGGDYLYRYIWKAIALIVIVQFITDPVLKVYTGVRWDNNALIGGMGNPNVYGLYLLVSAAYLYFFSTSFHRMLSVPLALNAILTGSMVCSLVAVLMALMIMVRYFILSGYLAKGLLMMLLFTSVVLTTVFLDTNLEELRAMAHVIMKIQGMLNLSDASAESASVAIRLAYTQEGLSLLQDNPVSLLVGHPDYLPIFNGDGTWISLIVTHGILITLLFQLSNIYLIFRSSRHPKIEFVFSFFVLIVFQFFFITNRILDYWPAGFIYLLAFSYCASRGIHKKYLYKRNDR
jgi:hypothetical protein